MVTPRNRARPRYETKPTKGAQTWQRDLWRTADRLGTPFMPWQKKAGRLLAEYSDQLCTCHDPPIPLPRYKTVAASVPRQQGKTVVSRVAITTVAEREPDLEVFGTAQSGKYAAKHVISLGDILGANVKTYRASGHQKVVFPNGSTYAPITPNEGGGHGDSIDFMLVDEGWALVVHVLGGITPAMIARPHSQMLLISTMGTLESTVWNGIVESGREGDDETMAYIEYSAPTDEAVFQDNCTDDSQIGTKKCVWGQWMPALGITVSHADIRAAINLVMKDPELGANEVVRAFGNRTVKQLVTLFPQDWIKDAWRVIEPPTNFVLAVDVNDDPVGASVSTGHVTEDGNGAVRTIEARFGTPRWVPAYLAEICSQRSVEALVFDPGSPTRQIKAEIEAVCEEHNVTMVERTTRDVAADTQRFYDALREKKVHLLAAEPLEDALSKAVKKEMSDTGLWYINRRKMAVDASPLVSAILAHGLALELDVKPKIEAFIY